MTRVNIGLFIILIALLVCFQPTGQASVAAIKESPTPTIIPTPTVEPIGKPVRFFIPKINVDAPVEGVGTDENGKMILPEELTKVGWYEDGYKPGQNGNAVIAGHLDATTGAGAIFYYLHTLVPGDTMSVLDENGILYTYTVTKKESYPYDQVPISEVFGPSDQKNLNLVTCTGWWNAAMHNYSERMVIYSTLTSKVVFTPPTTTDFK